MYNRIAAAICFVIATVIEAWAQPSVLPHGTVVDLREAAGHFAELFEQTCYRHRHALVKLQTEPPAQQWQRVLGPFPIREESQRSNTLVEWGLWSRGVPYTMALVVFDDSAPAVTCIVSAGATHKSTLPAAIQHIGDLKILKEIQTIDNKTTAIGSKSESDLIIVCTTPVEDQLYNGQCGLVLAPNTSAL